MAYRNAWDDMLRLQYETSEAFAYLYKPLEPSKDAESRHQPTETPARYMQKCLGIQKMYSDLKTDLQQELSMIDVKLLRPAQEAKAATKSLQKTLKHRENTKLDYERYLSRAEHARRKDTRTVKEEIALATHENNLAQAQIDYQTADDQVKQTFPPVTDAIVSLVPHLLKSLVRLQTTLVGQMYTVLDEYTKKFRMPNPAPSDAEIIDVWEREFSGFRKELEQGISLIASGKAVQSSMALSPEKDKSTITGLGIRNKVMHRKGSGQSGTATMLQRPTTGSRTSTGQLIGSGVKPEEQQEMAPPKPPRPGGNSLMSMSSPNIPSGSNPRMPSHSTLAPFDDKSTTQWQRTELPPPSYEQASSGATTPPSRYATPVNGTSPSNTSASASASDYFTQYQQRTSRASPLASSVAGKKKPPPVPPKKVQSQEQYAEYVTAIYDFEGQNDGDLAFREGDRIRVVKKTESADDWWDGELNGKVGVFPANYVQA